MTTKYGKASQTTVKKAVHKLKAGTLKSGRSHKKVASRKQAIAIGLSEARKKGAKVPAKKRTSSTTKRTGTAAKRAGTTVRKTSTTKRKSTTARKPAAKKRTAARKTTSRTKKAASKKS